MGLEVGIIQNPIIKPSQTQRLWDGKYGNTSQPTILFKAVCLAPLPPDRWRVRLQGGIEKVRSLTHLSGF